MSTPPPDNRLTSVRSQVSRTILWLVVIVATAYFASRFGLFGELGRQAIELEAPSTVALASDRVPTPLRVTATYTNMGDNPITLQVANPCRIFRWMIVNRQGALIQGMPSDTCTQVVMTSHLQKGESVQDSFVLELDTKRYSEADDYRLIYEFWGNESYHDFSVSEP